MEVEKQKIQELWSYLKIQDDEILIIQHGNCDSEEYYVSEIIDGKLVTRVEYNMPELSGDKPFTMIRQRDNNNKYTIPSVKQLSEDKEADY